ISQHYIRENRTRFPLKNSAVLVINRKSDNVRGQQIGGELDALKSAIERTCERVGQSCLTDAGHVFHQQVTAGDESHNRQSDRFRLALDDSLHRALQAFNLFDRIGAGYLSATDRFEVPHELVCILHAKSTRGTEKLAAAPM